MIAKDQNVYSKHENMYKLYSKLRHQKMNSYTKINFHLFRMKRFPLGVIMDDLKNNYSCYEVRKTHNESLSKLIGL